MSFVGAIRSCFQKYAGFRGRAPRSEYWFFALFNILIVVALFALWGLGGKLWGQTAGAILMAVAGIVWLLAVFVPSLAVAVRRLHDTNSSGWWYLIAFVPYVGGLILLIWFCVRGTHGENRFGEDPLESISEVFA